MGQRVRYLVTGGLIPLLALLLMLGYLTDGVESSSENNSPQLFAPFTKSMPEIDADRSNRPASEIDFSAAGQLANATEFTQAPTQTPTITLFEASPGDPGSGQVTLRLVFEKEGLLPPELYLHFWHPSSLRIDSFRVDGQPPLAANELPQDQNTPTIQWKSWPITTIVTNTHEIIFVLTVNPGHSQEGEIRASLVDSASQTTYHIMPLNDEARKLLAQVAPTLEPPTPTETPTPSATPSPKPEPTETNTPQPPVQAEAATSSESTETAPTPIIATPTGATINTVPSESAPDTGVGTLESETEPTTITPEPTPPGLDEETSFLDDNLWYLLIPLGIVLAILLFIIAWRMFKSTIIPPPPPPGTPYLELVSDPKRSYPITKSSTIIGRALNNDIIIDEKIEGWETISRRHATINEQEGEYIVEDLQSHNGIKVNGRPTVKNLLRDGWQVTFGEVDFVFRTGQARGDQEGGNQT